MGPRRRWNIPHAVLFLLGALLGRCGGDPAPVNRCPMGIVASNRIDLNAVVTNGSPFGALHEGPLTLEGLSSSANAPILVAARADKQFRGVLRYLVQCALRPEQRVDLGGTPPLVFEGAVGLAPEWSSGPCDEACQEWVTACLLARTNVYGVQVRISLRADHPSPALQTDEAERREFDVEEGAFYGNFFQSPPRQYACRGRGYDAYLQSFRVCALPGHRCGIQVVGTCSDVDGLTGAASDRRACERQGPTGVYANCHNRPTLPGSAAFPEPNRTYPRVITVFVRRTAGVNDAPETPPASGDCP